MNNVINYLEDANKKYKDKIAIIEEDKKITYEKLVIYSKSVASFLIQKDLFNKPIIIFMDKGIDTLISFFGCVYSANFYSLINPEFPKMRINSIKDTINANYIITDDNYFELAKECFPKLEILNINDLKKHKILNKEIELSLMKHIDCDPLYVNFTSGSTGNPKGVVISHRSVIDFINYFTELFNFNSNDIIANQAPFDFDVSVKDIYSSIKVGATLVIIPKAYFSNPTKLLDYLVNNKVTTLTWAVSALCLITTFHGLDYRVPMDIKKVIFSGEVMPLKHLREWMNKLPHAMFVNVYGPTEITCNCTYHIIDRERDYQDNIPIGKPFPNERVFLLDENNHVINDKNITGEICVSGSSLALGYYNNSSQTNKMFTQNPNQDNYLELIYHTGDLAYLDNNDDYIFMGRKDFQIKHQGHRIELEEIDKAIMNCHNIIRCCTIYDHDKDKLYGFYIGDLTKQELRHELSEMIPIYMIPSPLIQIEEFPLTKNGKIDRHKLMEMKERK